MSDHCSKCYLFSLVTPVYSLHYCVALFSLFSKLNDDDDDDDDDNNFLAIFVPLEEEEDEATATCNEYRKFQ